MAELEPPGILTTRQKVAVVGVSAAAAIAITVLAFRVSRCRRDLWNYGRASYRKRPLDATFYRARAARRGCDWPERLSW